MVILAGELVTSQIRPGPGWLGQAGRVLGGCSVGGGGWRGGGLEGSRHLGRGKETGAVGGAATAEQVLLPQVRAAVEARVRGRRAGGAFLKARPELYELHI